MLGINTKKTIYVATLLMALAVLSANPSTAQAQSARLSVRVVLASHSGSGIDHSLSSIASPLRSRFGQYNSFELLANHSMSLNSGASQSVTLPNGQNMSVSYQGMSGSSYRIRVSLPGGGTTVTAPPGGIFFVAGPRYSGGIIIIAITP